jgi:hypothetical protein
MTIADRLRRPLVLLGLIEIMGLPLTAPAFALDVCAPTVVGYFDHTAAWYRNRPQFRPDQMFVHTWNAAGQHAIVVLYSDISPTTAKGRSDYASIQVVRKRIEARENDIAEYLDIAKAKGNIRVLLQIPPELLLRWGSEPATHALLVQFVKHWSQSPALAGFYVADEPELRAIPTRTLQDITKVIKLHAPEGRNTAAISVAYSGQRELSPLLRSYARASPRAFDLLLANRYPVYRKYGIFARGPASSMGVKLGLTDEKARRENLAENEFANFDDYFDSVVSATRLPGLDGRPIYASMQAYGLRDDCDGADCKATKERNARRSPTWNELLQLFTSVWMSGANGAVLYSHYFSLYDQALRKRLDNLHGLMGSVYRNLPGCGPALSPGTASPEGVMARYAAQSNRARPDYLVIMHSRRTSASVPILFDRNLRIARVEEQRFDTHGNPRDPVRHAVTMDRNGGRAMRLAVDGYGVSILKLIYE